MKSDEKTIYTEYFDPEGEDPGPEVYACGRARCYQRWLPAKGSWFVWIHGKQEDISSPNWWIDLDSKEKALNWIVEHSDD